MQTSNPTLGTLEKYSGQVNFGGTDAVATISGTTTKALLLVALTFIVGYFSLVYSINSILTTGAFPKVIMYGALIIAFILGLVTTFKPNVAPITAPIYSVFEGIALGMLSALFEFKYPGIVSTAVISTFTVVIAMLFLWKFKIIVPTAKFKAVITGAIAGIAVLYLLNFVLHLFNITLLPDSGPLSIAVSLIVCTVAALSLILDFDSIQSAVEQGLPKYFEYYNAFSLLVTICWLYIEILRLLSKRE